MHIIDTTNILTAGIIIIKSLSPANIYAKQQSEFDLISFGRPIVNS
jgi:hypothetical protein